MMVIMPSSSSSSAALAMLMAKAADMAINWYPGHMASASRLIRQHLRNVDMVIEVRDARIPLSSANKELQHILSRKKRLIVFNKMDLANPNMIVRWGEYFEACGCPHMFVNAKSAKSVQKMLDAARDWLKEKLVKEPTLLLMLLGIPNVGKSALLNKIYQITRSDFPAQEHFKRAKEGPLPGVTRHISGFQVARHPSIFALDTPGVLVPNIGDLETGLKLSLTGAVKDSVVGEERIAKYLLSLLNTRHAYARWKPDVKSDEQVEGGASGRLGDVWNALASTFQTFQGSLEDDKGMEMLVDAQLNALLGVYNVTDGGGMRRVAEPLLRMYRAGSLGRYTWDVVPNSDMKT